MSITQGTSSAGQEIAVTLSNGTILFVTSQNMTIKRSIAGVKWGKADIFNQLTLTNIRMQMS